MVDFVAPVYHDRQAVTWGLHGPTLRVVQGDTVRIRLANNLTRPGAHQSAAPLNGFTRVADTNNHNHGMHVWPGIADQGTAAQYRGGDNILFSVPGKGHDSQRKLSREDYQVVIPDTHMPGMAWYHPHQHGSTTVQVPTANGLIIIEGGPEWMPDSNGCREVRELKDAAPEQILHFQLLPFRPPEAATPQGSAQWADDLDDPNMQVASRLYDPPNPLCCGEGAARHEHFGGTATDRDLVLVNGHWQPRLAVQSGKFYRWRLAWATPKRFATLVILGPDGRPAPCEMQLISKDGVYLMQIPRRVDHALLAPGNRAEMFVRCTGAAGARYTLRAQDPAASPIGCSMGNTRQVVVQDLLAIDIKEGGREQPSPREKACTPARAGYVADLRDESLAAYGAASKLQRVPLDFTFHDFGCLVNDKNFSFPDPDPLQLPLGSVVEWASSKLHGHPLHIHTNPFQLQELREEWLQEGCSFTSWFEAGDYHDTLMLPMVTRLSAPRVRMQPGEFTGYTVVHCHALHHEDEGCMKLVRFTCPGHEDPQPQDCPGFAFPVPETVVRRKYAAAAQPELTNGSWLVWAQRLARRFGFSFV